MLTVGELLDRINEALARRDIEREDAVFIMLTRGGAAEADWLAAGIAGVDPENGFFITAALGEPPPEDAADLGAQ
jgi:hypothetical protein